VNDQQTTRQEKLCTNMFFGSRRAAAAILAALVTACVGPPAPEIEVDLREPCESYAQQLLSPDFLPGKQTWDLAGDRYAQSPGWAMTSQDGEFLLERIGDSRPDRPPAVSVNTPGFNSRLRLQPGPKPGETWFVDARTAGLTLTQLNADGVLAMGPTIDFPSSGAWDRALIFIGYTPYLLAIPRSSATPEYTIWLAQLNEALDIGTTWQLNLRASCEDYVLCDLLTFPNIELLDVADPDGASPALVLLGFDEVLDANSRSLYVATLRVGLEPETQHPIALRREYFPRQVWPVGGSLQAHVSPGQLVRDPDGYYILAGLTQESLDDPSHQLDAIIVRYDNLTDTASAPYSGLPTYTSPHLLQLDNRTAVGQISEGAWHIAPIVPGEYSDFEIDLDHLSSLPLTDDSSALVPVLAGSRGQVVHKVPGAPEIHTLVTCAGAETTRSGADVPAARPRASPLREIVTRPSRQVVRGTLW